MESELHGQNPIIRRLHRTSDETSPWAGIVFTEKVGSDALADLLMKAYPYPTGKSLRERKHLAAIDFLKAELEMMNDLATSQDSMDAGGVGSPSGASHVSQDTTSRSSQHSMSPFSSPRLNERDQRHEDQKLKATNSGKTPLQSAMQTIVFSATDGRAMQLKTRRTMTPQEREGYKQTRKRGACHKCKKTKAKCTHGELSQIEITDLSTPKKPSKRRASTPGRDIVETKKIPKTEPRIPLDTQLTTVPEDQPRSRTVPLSPQSYQITDNPGRRQWAPGVGRHDQLSSSNEVSSDSEASESSDTPTPANTTETRLTTPISGVQ